MPAQTTKSNLLGKLGKRLGAATDAQRGKAPAIDAGGGLPPGIDNGVAHLTMVKMGVYETGDLKGEDYWMAMGVAVLPREHRGIPVAGRQVKLGPLPLCDLPERTSRATGKPVTFEEQWATMLSYLKVWAGPKAVDTLTGTPDAILAGVKKLMQAVTAPTANVYFRFRTWQGKKTKITQRQGKWYVVEVEDADGKEREGKVRAGPFVSEAAARQSRPGKGAGREPFVNEVWGEKVTYTPGGNGEAPANQASTTYEEHADHEESAGGGETAGEGTDPDADGSLTALAEEADANPDSDADDRLKAIALQAGVDESVFDDEATTWADVVQMIRARAGFDAEGEAATGDEGEEPTEEPAADWAPAVGDVYLYAPPNPKDKGKTKLKAVEVEVTAADATKGTATLKNLTNPKLVYKAVPWDALESGT